MEKKIFRSLLPLCLCALFALLTAGCAKTGGDTAELSPSPTEAEAILTLEPEETEFPPAPTEAPAEIAEPTPRPTLPPTLNFTDPAFENCVRQQLDIPEGEPIRREQTRSLERLIISSEQIKSLDDLDKFPAVTWITLKTAKDADLSGLAMCSELQKLWINDGCLSDISFVSSLKKLELFNFCGNGNVDLSPLFGLDELKTLYMSGCGAADLTPVAGLELTSLSISGMPGANFEVLSQMKTLDYLAVYDCDLTSINFVSGLYALHTLVIGSNNITDLTPLTSIDSLEHLDAENNFISDIGVLFKLPQLYDVELSWNPVDSADIEALREAIKDHGPAYGDPPQHDNHVYAYPYDRDKLACWPVDLDGDGEDEYFYADLNLLTGDFISYVWLENKDHHRLGCKMQCGTGHVAFASFALVESPEYGACIMKTEPIFGGSDYAYSLMTLVDGRFETVYSETFYNSDFEIGIPFDPAEAKAYEERVNALYASGRLLLTTDRWGGMIDQEFVCTSPETPVPTDRGDIFAVICACGSTGPGLNWLTGSEYAEHFIIYYKPAYSRVKVEPYIGN